MTEAGLNSILADDRYSLPDRESIARSVCTDRSKTFSIRSQAACWLTYRGIESGDWREDVAWAAMQDPGETRGEVLARWLLSLRTAWIYTKIARGGDVRGYLWSWSDWNALKADQAAGVNLCRLALLLCIQERVANSTSLARACLLFRRTWTVTMLPFQEAPHPCAGDETANVAATMRAFTHLAPYLGEPYSGEPVELWKIAAEDFGSSVFSSVIAVALQPLFPPAIDIPDLCDTLPDAVPVLPSEPAAEPEPEEIQPESEPLP